MGRYAVTPPRVVGGCDSIQPCANGHRCSNPDGYALPDGDIYAHAHAVPANPNRNPSGRTDNVRVRVGEQAPRQADQAVHLLVHRAEHLSVNLRLALLLKRNVDLSLYDGQGRSELVRGVGCELTLTPKRLVQSGDHLIECPGQTTHLIIR